MSCIPVRLVAMVILMAQADSTGKIIGKWKTVEETNGFHFVEEYGKSDTYSLMTMMEATSTYSVRRGVVHFKNPKLGEDTHKFKLEGNYLYLYNIYSEGPKRPLKLTRLEKSRKNAQTLVGHWQASGAFSSDSDHRKYTITFEFTDEGRTTTTVEFEPQRGTYKINGDQLTSTLEGMSSTNRFGIKDDILTHYEANSVTKFKRIR